MRPPAYVMQVSPALAGDGASTAPTAAAAATDRAIRRIVRMVSAPPFLGLEAEGVVGGAREGGSAGASAAEEHVGERDDGGIDGGVERGAIPPLLDGLLLDAVRGEEVAGEAVDADLGVVVVVELLGVPVLVAAAADGSFVEHGAVVLDRVVVVGLVQPDAEVVVGIGG